MKSKRRLFDSFCWKTYVRSFVLTLGLLFVALPVLSWVIDEGAANWPTWAYLVLFALFSLGATLLAVGIFANDDRVERWAEDASAGGLGILVIMISALPIYALLSLFKRKHRDS